MRTVRLWISYDGTDYAGWQRQSNGEAIQEVIERALALITGDTLTVHGAGRTDAGVHAFAQSAHVRLAKGPPTEALHKALNTLLPPDIRVLGARDMPSSFHARFAARAKRYLYRIRTDAVAPPIGRRFFHWFSGGQLDLQAMRGGAHHLIGTHDFAALATNPGAVRPRATVRTIHSLHLRGCARGVDLVVQGDGFLYNMVRTLAGTLLEVGRGRQDPAWVATVVASRDRGCAGPTLPPHGLFLVRVLYPPEFGPDRPPDQRSRRDRNLERAVRDGSRA